MPVRNVVSATWITALSMFFTSSFARTGSTMRYQTTAFTLIGTLSLVIVSCSSTAVVLMRRSIVYFHSMKGMIQ